MCAVCEASLCVVIAKQILLNFSTDVAIEQYLSNRARGGRVPLQLELNPDG